MTLTVSVNIPVFNGQDYIGVAVESVLQQTLQDFEIIVCDDKSTDETVSVVESFARRDSRVRLLKNKANRGVSHARNRAIEAARGEWIAFLDADDRYLPERLEALIDLGRQYDADLVCDNEIWISPSGKEIRRAVIAHGEASEATELSAANYIARDTRLAFKYGYLQPIVRKGFLDRHGIRYDEDLRLHGDFEFMARCLIKGGRCIITSQPYYLYLQRSDSVSHTARDPFWWFDYAQSITRSLLELPEAQSDQAIGEALRARLKFFDNLKSYRRLVDAIKAGDLRSALKYLPGDPKALPLYARVFHQNMRNRVIRVVCERD